MVLRHSAPRSPRTRIFLAGALALVLILAGAAAIFWPRGSDPAPTAATTPAPAGSVTPDQRDADRPSRGGTARAQQPNASPAPPAEAEEPSESGEVVETDSCDASYYWEPQPTASGEEFDPEAMTAAHKTWDFDTRVRVTNPDSGESVVVRINDRGPYIDGRCLDLSRGAFRKIASLDAGVITATYEVLSD